MGMKYGVIVPQGWRMDLVGINDPMEAYETMTQVARKTARMHEKHSWYPYPRRVNGGSLRAHEGTKKPPLARKKGQRSAGKIKRVAQKEA